MDAFRKVQFYYGLFEMVKMGRNGNMQVINMMADSNGCASDGTTCGTVGLIDRKAGYGDIILRGFSFG